MIRAGSGLWRLNARAALRDSKGRKFGETSKAVRTNLATTPTWTDTGTNWQTNNNSLYVRTQVIDPTCPAGVGYVRFDCVSGTTAASAYGVGHLWSNSGEGVITVPSGDTYMVSIFVHHNGYPLRSRLSFNVYDAAGANLQGTTYSSWFTDADALPAGGGWGRVYGTFTTTSAGTLRVGFSSGRIDGGGAAGHAVSITGALVEVGTELLPYFSGDFCPDDKHTAAFVGSSRGGSTLTRIGAA